MAQTSSKLILAGKLADGLGGEVQSGSGDFGDRGSHHCGGTAASDSAASTAGYRADRLEQRMCDAGTD